MSFGTGQHATTAYCLKMIDQLADEEGVETFLDAGCGSGILTIGAAKLGYQDLHAFDFDPDAVMIAEENFEINEIAKDSVKLTVDDAEVYQAGKQFDLVCANILGHLLIKFKNNIATWVKPGKYLVLAGILNEEFDNLSKEFTSIGFTELNRFSEKEWTGGLFKKN
jgi:ribosomal protein L11 methyltransferase